MYIKIKGYENYIINKFGTVKRKVDGLWKEVKSTYDSNKRYKIITLWKCGKRRTFMLHNLVAENFSISVEDAKRSCYYGYTLTPGAKENVRDFLLSAIAEREKQGEAEEGRYLRDCLEVIK